MPSWLRPWVGFHQAVPNIGWWGGWEGDGLSVLCDHWLQHSCSQALFVLRQLSIFTAASASCTTDQSGSRVKLYWLPSIAQGSKSGGAEIRAWGARTLKFPVAPSSFCREPKDVLVGGFYVYKSPLCWDNSLFLQLPPLPPQLTNQVPGLNHALWPQ